MCEKKTVLSVVLGVALVALISSIVVAAIDGLTMLIDYTEVYGEIEEAYPYILAALELVAAAIAIAFVVVLILVKNKRNMIVLILGIVSAAYFVITAIVLRCVIPTNTYYGYIYKEFYVMFSAYLTNVASLAVSLVLSAVAVLLLARLKAKHNAEKAEACDNTNTAEQTENNIAE